MKNFFFGFLLTLTFVACQSDTTPAAWTTFKKCATSKCVAEAAAVKDALLNNPTAMLTAFQATYEKGEDHLIGWLFILRDSILTNPATGTLEARTAMRDALTKAVKSNNDPKLKEIAHTVTEGLETISFVAETEDGEVDDDASDEPVIDPKSIPQLSPKDSAIAAKLVGEWQSTTDPKSRIRLADGRFTYLVEGEKTPELSLRYFYYPTCPKDCNPVGQMPCLKVIGQDDVCYTIVKADGQTLSLSQIGGTGNTNVYTRKK